MKDISKPLPKDYKVIYDIIKTRDKPVDWKIIYCKLFEK